MRRYEARGERVNESEVVAEGAKGVKVREKEGTTVVERRLTIEVS